MLATYDATYEGDRVGGGDNAVVYGDGNDNGRAMRTMIRSMVMMSLPLLLLPLLFLHFHLSSSATESALDH